MQLNGQDLLTLADTGRWVERMVPVGQGDDFVMIACMYGHSGASTDPTLARLNERLLRTAIARAATFVELPYILCADFNTKVENSAAVTLAVEAGILHDACAEWMAKDGGPDPTYKKSGVYRSMEGPGTTRIDSILANSTAMALVGNVEYLYPASMCQDHVAIKITLEKQRFQTKVLRAGRPVGINVDKHIYSPSKGASKAKRKELQAGAGESFGSIWNYVQKDFQQALEQGDVDEGHRLWSLACELWLFLTRDPESDYGPEEELFSMKKYQ